MSDDGQTGRQQTDRRQFLKRAGLMTVWVAPAVQVVNVAAARAQDVKASVTTSTAGTTPTVPSTEPTVPTQCTSVQVNCAVSPGASSVNCGGRSISISWQDGFAGFTFGELSPWTLAAVQVSTGPDDTEVVPVFAGQTVSTLGGRAITGLTIINLLCEEDAPNTR